MKKKIVSMALVIALVAIAVVGGSLAYFTDTDEATNVIAVGNVDIELIESYVHRSAATGYESVTGYPEVASGEHDDKQVLSGSGDAYTAYLKGQTLVPGVEVNKMPYVKNNGSTAAYVRIRVMIPTEHNTTHLNSSNVCTTALEEEFSRPAGLGSEYDVDNKVTIDNVEYDVYTFIRNEPLAPKTMTHWNVWNTIRMDESVTSDKFEGVENFNVIVEVDAIQADSFGSAAEAWTAFDAQ